MLILLLVRAKFKTSQQFIIIITFSNRFGITREYFCQEVKVKYSSNSSIIYLKKIKYRIIIIKSTKNLNILMSSVEHETVKNDKYICHQQNVFNYV